MEIIHARRSTHPRWYVVSASALRWRAYGAERCPSNLLQWQTVYRVTQFKMIFTQDGKMTPSGLAEMLVRKLGHLESGRLRVCTSWKGPETNCYTVVPSGKNKWSIQKGSTAVAVSSLIRTFLLENLLPAAVASANSGQGCALFAAVRQSA